MVHAALLAEGRAVSGDALHCVGTSLLGPVANITGYEWVLKHVKPLIAFQGMHLLPF